MPNAHQRQRLLSAAIAAIEAGGEVSLRVRDIADSCDVSTPILYRAFGDREGLIIAAQTERYRRTWLDFLEPFGDLIARCTTTDHLRATIAAIITASYQPERERFRRIRAEVLGSSMSRPELAAAIDAAFTDVVTRAAEALAAKQTEGLLAPDVDLLTGLWWFFGQIDGRVLLEMTSAPVDRDVWDAISQNAAMRLLFGD